MILSKSGWLESQFPGDPKLHRCVLPQSVKDDKGKAHNKFRKGPSKWLTKNNNGCWLGIVVHYTAGMSGIKSAQSMITRPDPVSTHFIVDRDGTISQCLEVGGVSDIKTNGRPVIDPNFPPCVAHHAGLAKSDVPQRIKGPLGDVLFDDPNGLCVGLDLALVGPVKKRGDKFYWWPNDYKTPFTGPVVKIGDGYWEKPTELQIRSTVALSRLLVQRFGIHKEYIVPHSTVAPKRKMDVGPAFPWDDYFRKVYGESAGAPAIVQVPIGMTFVDVPLEPGEEMPVDQYPMCYEQGIAELYAGRANSPGLIQKVVNKLRS